MIWVTRHILNHDGVRYEPGAVVTGLDPARAEALAAAGVLEERPGPAAPAAPVQGVDDLTRLKGVGAATARALAEAGYGSFARLAEAEPEVVAASPALRGIRASLGDLAAWRAEAAGIAAVEKEPDVVEKDT